jgi:hypothetical protein
LNGEWFNLKPQAAEATLKELVSNDRELYPIEHAIRIGRYKRITDVFRTRLTELLSQNETIRIFGIAGLREYAAQHDVHISERQTGLFIEYALHHNFICRIKHGIYTNNICTNAATTEEAAQLIRKNAIVSLHTVLGDCELIPNYPNEIYSIIPIVDGGAKPNLKTIPTESGDFHFKGIKSDIVEAGEYLDRLDVHSRIPKATPEAALIHWIYLSQARRSSMQQPSLECNINLLDLERLNRLAVATNLVKTTDLWLDACRNRRTLST